MFGKPGRLSSVHTSDRPRSRYSVDACAPVKYTAVDFLGIEIDHALSRNRGVHLSLIRITCGLLIDELSMGFEILYLLSILCPLDFDFFCLIYVGLILQHGQIYKKNRLGPAFPSCYFFIMEDYANASVLIISTNFSVPHCEHQVISKTFEIQRFGPML